MIMGMKTYNDYKEFLNKKMKMTGIYQPVIIRLLLENDGRVSLQKIAQFIAPLDSEIVGYYVERLKTYPKATLLKHKIADIPKRSSDFRTLEPLEITDVERVKLIEICDKKIADWLEKNPDLERVVAGWGKLRHDMLADHRYCAMCVQSHFSGRGNLTYRDRLRF